MESVANYFRTTSITANILPFIKAGNSQILDIGAGSCHIAKTLITKYGLRVTAVDVVNHNITDLPLKIYDGKKLPYVDKQFEFGLLVFVLHHAPDSRSLISEAGRVCKNLIIVEDLPSNRVERACWKHLDYLLNHGHHADIEVAHRARSLKEWKTLFNSLNYALVKTKKFRSLFTTGLTYPHVVFVLNQK